MGRYDPIWNRLKKDGSVTLAVPVPLQPRVIKAVIRTKDEDVIYKFELSEKILRAELEYKIEGARIVFTLKKYFAAKYLTTEDL